VRSGSLPDAGDQRVDRAGILELDPGPRQRRLDEVQVGIGQPRQGGLVRPERDDACAGSGRGVDVAPCRHDPPVRDADRLDPARAVVTGEGRDPAKSMTGYPFFE
jgi:hypothetical protein